MLNVQVVNRKHFELASIKTVDAQTFADIVIKPNFSLAMFFPKTEVFTLKFHHSKIFSAPIRGSIPIDGNDSEVFLELEVFHVSAYKISGGKDTHVICLKQANDKRYKIYSADVTTTLSEAKATALRLAMLLVVAIKNFIPTDPVPKSSKALSLLHDLIFRTHERTRVTESNFWRKLKRGKIICVQRFNYVYTYFHYGVYIGNNEVIHVSGQSKSDAALLKSTIPEFMGKDMLLFTADIANEDCDQTAKRAIDAYEFCSSNALDPDFVTNMKGAMLSCQIIEGADLCKSLSAEYYDNLSINYQLTARNCEHFAFYCALGKWNSSQVYRASFLCIDVGGNLARVIVETLTSLASYLLPSAITISQVGSGIVISLAAPLTAPVSIVFSHLLFLIESARILRHKIKQDMDTKEITNMILDIIKKAVMYTPEIVVGSFFFILSICLLLIPGLQLVGAFVTVAGAVFTSLTHFISQYIGNISIPWIQNQFEKKYQTVAKAVTALHPRIEELFEKEIHQWGSSDVIEYIGFVLLNNGIFEQYNEVTKLINEFRIKGIGMISLVDSNSQLANNMYKKIKKNQYEALNTLQAYCCTKLMNREMYAEYGREKKPFTLTCFSKLNLEEQIKKLFNLSVPVVMNCENHLIKSNKDVFSYLQKNSVLTVKDCKLEPVEIQQHHIPIELLKNFVWTSLHDKMLTIYWAIEKPQSRDWIGIYNSQDNLIKYIWTNNVREGKKTIPFEFSDDALLNTVTVKYFTGSKPGKYTEVPIVPQNYYDYLNEEAEYIKNNRPTEVVAKSSDKERSINSEESCIRIQKDFQELNKKWTDNLSIPDEGQFNFFHLKLNPTDGIWKHCAHYFTIFIPEQYPYEPPKIKCIAKVFHPNIDSNGVVCSDILKNWTAALTLNIAFADLHDIFLNPKVDESLVVNQEAATIYKSDLHRFKLIAQNYLQGNYSIN